MYGFLFFFFFFMISVAVGKKSDNFSDVDIRFLKNAKRKHDRDAESN